MIHVIHTNPELNIKMGETVSEIGVQRGQRRGQWFGDQGELYVEGGT